MIRPYDTLVLAVTKLRTRHIRTAITVLLAGLLFGVLIAALAVSRGAVDSIHNFSKEGLNSRYIAQAYTDPPFAGNAVMQNRDLQARTQEIYDQTIADKKAAAKRLDIPYDPSTEQSPFITFPATAGQPEQKYLNILAPAAQQALQEWVSTKATPGLKELKQTAAIYHPSHFYEMRTLAPTGGAITTMQHGVEDFNRTPEQMQSNGKQSQPDIFQMGGLQLQDPAMTKPFILPTAAAADPNALPIIVPYSRAETLLGLTALPKSASAEQRLARIRDLYAKAGNITGYACYRNTVSSTQIETAITQAAEIAKNAGNKDYHKPTLIYGLPAADSCDQAPIISDTRTKDEKTLAAKQDEFTKEFGGTVDPMQQKLAFHVVGLAPDPEDGSSKTTIRGILQDIVGSSLQGAIVVPADMFEKMPNVAQLKSLLIPTKNDFYLGSQTSYFVEFASADDARNFIAKKTCTTKYTGNCATPDKPFQLNAFGSNSIALQDLQNKFARFFRIAALVVVVLAIIILTGTIGRMIADGRRETAVFRATGAKRLDIALIYGFYTLLLSCIVAAASLVLGLIAAVIFDHHYWQQTTLQAKLLFGASDNTRVFHYFGIDVRQMGLVLLIAIGAGLVSMIIPIMRNVRRNPIKDMREE